MWESCCGSHVWTASRSNRLTGEVRIRRWSQPSFLLLYFTGLRSSEHAQEALWRMASGICTTIRLDIPFNVISYNETKPFSRKWVMYINIKGSTVKGSRYRPLLPERKHLLCQSKNTECHSRPTALRFSTVFLPKTSLTKSHCGTVCKAPWIKVALNGDSHTAWSSGCRSHTCTPTNVVQEWEKQRGRETAASIEPRRWVDVDG